MYYTASSVKKALDMNKKLSASEFSIIGCQNKKQIKQASFLICHNNPKICERALQRLCVRAVHIDDIGGRRKLLTVLRLRFIVSKANVDGFIRKDDFALAKLLREKYIDVKYLKGMKSLPQP